MPAIGVSVSPFHPGDYVRMALEAEELGFESIWMGEHLFRVSHPERRHPYGEPGKLSAYPVHDPLVLAAVTAAATTTIRVAVGVLILPLWDVYFLARSLRTAALVAGSRLIVGVGVGWCEEEFTATRRDFAARGHRADEMIPELGGLLASGSVSWPGGSDGSSYLFDESMGEPPTPAIEFLVGGDSAPALRRAARSGAGWYGHLDVLASMAEKQACLDADSVSPSPPFERGRWTVQVRDDVSRDDLLSLGSLGVERVVVSCVRPGKPDMEEASRTWRRIASYVDQGQDPQDGRRSR